MPRTFESVVQRLVTHVPGCPNPVIENFVRDAAIEVCERTLTWKYVHPAITLVPGTYSYLYVPPAGSEVHAFVHATLNNTRIAPLTLEQLYGVYPDWPNTVVANRSRPQHIIHIDADTFGMALVPGNAETYTVEFMVALKPLRTAIDMDTTVLDDIENAVMDGALAALYRLPTKNWTDPNLAAYHSTQFAYRISERRARANIGAGRASMSVRMRPLA